MPYATNRQLPTSVREHLPPEAQELFRKAFNHAFGRNRGDHAASARIAWAAVKQHYEQVEGEWRLKPAG